MPIVQLHVKIQIEFQNRKECMVFFTKYDAQTVLFLIREPSVYFQVPVETFVQDFFRNFRSILSAALCARHRLVQHSVAR